MNYLKIVFFLPILFQSCNNSSERRNSKGSELFFQGEYQQAIKEYNKDLEYNAYDCEAYEGRADCHMNLQNYQAEISDLTNAIKYGCNDGRVYNNLGDAYFKTGEIDLAIKQFEIAETLDFEPSTTKANLGLCYSAIRQFDKATKYFQDAIAIDPDSSINYYHLAIHYQQYGDLENALLYINKAILLKDNFPIYYIKRAAINGESENYQLSLNDTEKALRMNLSDTSELSDALWIKTTCLINLHKDTAACNSLHELRKFSPSYTEDDFGIKCKK